MGHAMRSGIAAAVLSTFIVSPAAHAGFIGTAAVADITLDGSTADGFQYASGVNPQKGKNGTTSGFSSAFSADGTGSWGLLSKFTSTAGNNSTAGAGALQLVFNKTDSRHGTWSVTNTNAAQDITLDLVFAMHAGNGSGAWLFDDQFIGAGATVSGAWNLNVFNDGKQYADYSNLTLFGRDTVLTAPKPVVKEPAPAAPSAAAGTAAPNTAASNTAAAGNPAANTTGSSTTAANTVAASATVPAAASPAQETQASTTLPAAPSTSPSPAAPATAPGSTAASGTATSAQSVAGPVQDVSGFATPSEAQKALGQTTAGLLMPEIAGNANNAAGSAASVPEPASLGIMAAGLALMALATRRRHIHIAVRRLLRGRMQWRLPRKTSYRPTFHDQWL